MSVKDTNLAKGRTLVEFYDTEYLENIVSLLYGEYTDVIYVYFSRANEPTAEDRRILSAYIKTNFGFTPQFLAISENTITCALDDFRRLVSDGGRYDFDITGGSSVFIAAAGALAAEGESDHITLHEYDVSRGKRIFSHPAQQPSEDRAHGVQLTVDDIFTLRGIKILHPERPIRYRLKQDDLRGEVLRLWEAIRGELKAWNNLSAIPTKITTDRDGIRMRKQMTAGQQTACESLLKALEKHGIISDIQQRQDGYKIFVTYRIHVPASALFLYDKAGNILEMLTYVTAVESGLFTDCCTGVSLDWDDRVSHKSADPWNELDAVLTRGHRAYFISCKNTEVLNDYLYEIMVMTRHYGGRYAVPGLMCTVRCNTHIHARAKEMGVVLIDNIGEMTVAEFAEQVAARLGR